MQPVELEEDSSAEPAQWVSSLKERAFAEGCSTVLCLAKRCLGAWRAEEEGACQAWLGI